MDAFRISIRCLAFATLAFTSSSLFADEPPKAKPPADPESLPEHAVARFGTIRFRHGAPITALAISSDGKYIASGSGDRSVRIWEAHTGKLLRSLRCESPYPTGVAFSPDGKQIAADLDSEFVSIIDWQTNQPPKQFRATVPRSVVWSPDGKLLGCAVVDEDSVLIIDALNGKQLHKFKDADRVAFAPDNKTFAVGLVGRTISLINIKDAKNIGELVRREKSTVVWMKFSKDGQHLLASNDVGSVEVWDVKQLKLTQSFEAGGFADFVSGDKAVAAISENRIALYDLQSGKKTETNVEAWRTTPFLFSGDGNRIFVGGPYFRIAVWNRTTGKEELAGEGHPGEVTGLAFGPQGDTLLSAGVHGIRLWSVKDNKELANGRRLNFNQVLALSPNARRFAIAEAQAIHIWNPVDLTAAKPYPNEPAYKLASTAEKIAFIAYTPDGERIAYAGGEKTLRFADPGRGAAFAPLYLTAEPQSAAFGPNGRSLAVITRDGLLTQWSISARGPGNVEPKDLELWKKRVQRAPRAAVAVSPNGLLIAASSVGRVLLLESISGRQWYGFDRQLGDGDVHCVAFSPDGRLLAVGHGGAEGIGRIWEVLTGKEVVTFRGHAGGINSIAFSPNGQRIASAGTDSSILVWDLALKSREADATALALRDAWDLLDSENTQTAYQAVGSMINAGDKAVAIIDMGLKGAIDNQARIRKLIGQLDDDDFRIRKNARAAIEKEALRAWPFLHEALETKRPQETERLVKLIIEGIEARGLHAPDSGLYGEALRTVRSIHILERVGGKDAVRVLEMLAANKSDTRISQEANAALERLRK
jgi:WD40 repeat protein